MLGAGLGTRLRPLTDDRPKPLVPLFDRPLVTLAFAHLAAAGVQEFVVNTHHLPEAWSVFTCGPNEQAEWQGLPIALRHEPVLLDTGGGIKNCNDLLEGGDFWVHNGDVLADLDLQSLWREHTEQRNVVTLGLRSFGGPLHVAFDPPSGRVVNIRGELGAAAAAIPCLYTGIAVVSPAIFSWIPAGRPVSIIPVLLDLIRAGERVGGKILDEGTWMDLGSIAAYKAAHWKLLKGPTLRTVENGWPRAMAASAVLEEEVELAGENVIGEGCRIGRGARLINCILWPGAEVAAGAHLKDCIVRRFAAGSMQSAIS